MRAKRRLLILSCSKRKRSTLNPLPAIERYDGPLFLVLRRFLRECPGKAVLLDVYILSADYGLISANYRISPYDRKMSRSRAIELRSGVLTAFVEIVQNDYASLCFAMGRTYLTVFSGWQDLVPANIELKIAEGPIGIKQTRLKEWLWEEKSTLC